MTRGLTLIGLFAISPACIVYDNGPGPAPANYAPNITWAEAGCFWDPVVYDYVWYFDSDVTDPDGLGDVFEVYADVYDEFSGAWVDSFLLENYGSAIWYTEWLQFQTYLDCGRPYVVEFVAYDYLDAVDFYSVYPLVYY